MILTPSYFGHLFGAQVASQRCPILRTDNKQLSKQILSIKVNLVRVKKKKNEIVKI